MISPLPHINLTLFWVVYVFGVVHGWAFGWLTGMLFDRWLHKQFEKIFPSKKECSCLNPN